MAIFLNPAVWNFKHRGFSVLNRFFSEVGKTWTNVFIFCHLYCTHNIRPQWWKNVVAIVKNVVNKQLWSVSLIGSFRGSDYLRIEAISHFAGFLSNQATLKRQHIWMTDTREQVEPGFSERPRWLVVVSRMSGGGPGRALAAEEAGARGPPQVEWSGLRRWLGLRLGRSACYAQACCYRARHLLRKHLIWHHFGRPKLGWYHLGVDLVPVLPLYVPPHGVVAREWAMAEWAGHTDSLVSLSDVSAEVGLVSIGSLAERAFQFRSWSRRKFPISSRIRDRNCNSGQITRWDA